MNNEKPEFKPWADLVKETKESIKFQEQNLTLAKAILCEAEANVAKK